MTLSYEVCKRLKEFLGEDAPEPIDSELWTHVPPKISSSDNCLKSMREHPYLTPVYKLHDILSKPFCEALAKKCDIEKVYPKAFTQCPWKEVLIRNILCSEYYDGGYPAVEKELMQMMEEKRT